MKHEHYTPSIVDFAYQVISMHEENVNLRREVEHYKELHEMYCKSTNDSIKNSEEFMGHLLVAALDPESVINKGHNAIIKERFEEE